MAAPCIPITRDVGPIRTVDSNRVDMQITIRFRRKRYPGSVWRPRRVIDLISTVPINNEIGYSVQIAAIRIHDQDVAILWIGYPVVQIMCSRTNKRNLSSVG